MATTACHSGSSGAYANSGPISSHARKRALASSPSGAAVAPSFTPERARYNNRCTASAFSLGSDSRRASTKATCSRPMQPLHNPCQLGDPQHFRAEDKIRSGPYH